MRWNRMGTDKRVNQMIEIYNTLEDREIVEVDGNLSYVLLNYLET